MAHVRPSLVVDSTNTSGTGSYTLINGDPGDGFRNLADAVADGDAANSDTISYFVVDTTTKGATLAWEHGTGTISGGGTTLARTAIIESSNGDLAVSWGAGGTRTIRFGAGTSGFALLAAAQTFTALQTLSAGLTSGDVITVEKATTTFAGAVTMRNASAGSTSNLVSSAQYLKDAGGTYRAALAIASDLPTITAGSDTSRVRFFCRNAGAETVAFQILNGALVDGSSVAYAKTGVLSAPSGTRLLIGNASVPTGWSIVASLADRTIMLTSTIGEVDDTGGSWTTGITGSTTVDGHALTTAEMPAHTHNINSHRGGTIVGSEKPQSTSATADGIPTVTATQSAGSGNTHSHTASTTIDSTSYRPAYYKAAFIAKT